MSKSGAPRTGWTLLRFGAAEKSDDQELLEEVLARTGGSGGAGCN